MPKPSFNERHQFIRNAIKEDLLQFALPALLIFTAAHPSSIIPHK
jgi:hypothetical protein